MKYSTFGVRTIKDNVPSVLMTSFSNSCHVNIEVAQSTRCIVNEEMNKVHVKTCQFRVSMIVTCDNKITSLLRLFKHVNMSIAKDEENIILQHLFSLIWLLFVFTFLDELFLCNNSISRYRKTISSRNLHNGMRNSKFDFNLVSKKYLASNRNHYESVPFSMKIKDAHFNSYKPKTGKKCTVSF